MRRDERLLPGEIPGKVSRFPLKKGDIVVMESSGGGGFGDPLERDLAKVSCDVTHGLVSRKRAYRRYGLVWQTQKVDPHQTKILREQLRQKRIQLRICYWDEEEHFGSRRICGIGVQTLTRFGLVDGELVELVNPKGAPLRAWIMILASAQENRIHLGATSLALLGVAESDMLEMRAIRFYEGL